MSFALPTAFWLIACAAPIIAFYILKVRLRRQNVSTNLFWKQIYDEKPPRSIWQYLRHLLSLLVQLLILALLVLAIADPYLPWELLQARRLVVVIDRSASMQAADVAPSRFAAAIDAAAAVIDGLRFRDELAIVSAGPQPEVVVGMSGHVPTLKRALRGIEVCDNPTNLDTAVELARQLVADHPRGEVLLYTDGCVNAPLATTGEPPTASEAAGKGPAVHRMIFGKRANNVGITQFQVRRSLVDPIGYEALVAVSNASDQDVQCRLEVALDEIPVDVIPLTLKPNEKWRRSLQKTSIDGGRLTATLTQISAPKAGTSGGAADSEESGDSGKAKKESSAANDASLDVLTVDDTASAILAARKPQNVLLVTEGNVFMQKVFQANPLVKCDVVKALPTEWPAETIVVLHKQVPPELPSRDVLIVEPLAGCDAWDLGDTMENPIITQQQSESPLMAHVRLDNMLMPEAKRLAFKSSPDILAGTLAGDAIYASVRRDKGKCLVLSVDLDRSDLAFRTAFPILVTNALNWFRGGVGELQSSLPTGQMAKFPLDTSKLSSPTKLFLRSPSGEEREVAAPPTAQTSLDSKSDSTAAGSTVAGSTPTAEISLGPFDAVGVWTLVSRASREAEAVVAEFAVNLANEWETDLRPLDAVAEQDNAVFAAGWFARPLWYYLALWVCAISVVEWMLHQRRVLT